MNQDERKDKSGTGGQPLPQQGNDLQGEGNYDATRRYDKAASDFARSGKVDEAARAAQPQNDAQAAELQRAEREGRSHSKGEDAGMADRSAVKPGKGA